MSAAAAVKAERQAEQAHANDLLLLATLQQKARITEPPLPEHLTRWPQTAEVEAAVRAGYDGTAPTNHAIGQRLVSAVAVKTGESYPSWRIEQIAVALGLVEARRDELLARLRQEEQERKAGRMRPPELHPRPAQTKPAQANERETMTTMSTKIHGDAPAVAALLATAATPTPTSAHAPQHTPHQRRASSEPKEREARCAYCGTPFTAKRYSTGWTRYCTARCGRLGALADRAAAEHTEIEHTAEPLAPAPKVAETTETTETTETIDDGAVDREPYWNGERWTTLAETLDAEADHPVPATSEPTPPVQPDEPASGLAEPTSQADETPAGSGLNGLLTLWNLLTQPRPQPLFAPQMSPWPVLQGGAFAGPSASRSPTTAAAADEDVADAADDGALDDLLSFYRKRLPASHAWTTRERGRWLRAFTAALDLEIVVSDEQEEQA